MGGVFKYLKPTKKSGIYKKLLQMNITNTIPKRKNKDYKQQFKEGEIKNDQQVYEMMFNL